MQGIKPHKIGVGENPGRVVSWPEAFSATSVPYIPAGRCGSRGSPGSHANQRVQSDSRLQSDPGPQVGAMRTRGLLHHGSRPFADKVTALPRLYRLQLPDRHGAFAGVEQGNPATNVQRASEITCYTNYQAPFSCTPVQTKPYLTISRL